MTKSSNYCFGHKVVRDFYSAEEISLLQQEVNKLIAFKDTSNFLWKYFEGDPPILSRIEYFVKHSEFFKKTALSDKVLMHLSLLHPSSAHLFKDKINFKYPQGAGFIGHQDIAAGWGEYEPFHVTLAIPLAPITKENGGLEFGGTMPKQLTPNFTDFSPAIEESISYQSFYSTIGDVVFFDSYVPHRSFVNNSSVPRPIVFFTYTFGEASHYEQYHKDKFANNPPDIYKKEGVEYRTNQSCGEVEVFTK